MANPKIKIKRTQVIDMSSINLEPGELCVNTNTNLSNVYRGIIKYSNGSQRYIPTGTIQGGALTLENINRINNLSGVALFFTNGNYILTNGMGTQSLGQKFFHGQINLGTGEYTKTDEYVLKNEVLTLGPDYANIVSTLGLPEYPTSSSTESYTCPSSGYVMIGAVRSETGYNMNILINGNVVAFQSGVVPFGEHFTLPVSANDVISVSTNTTSQSWRITQQKFVPNKIITQ